MFSPRATADFEALEARYRATTKRAIDVHLRHRPAKVGKSRIKRLRDMRQPQFRLRVDELRIYYDVDESLQRVEVLRIIPKPLAEAYVAQEGVPDEADSVG